MALDDVADAVALSGTTLIDSGVERGIDVGNGRAGGGCDCAVVDDADANDVVDNGDAFALRSRSKRPDIDAANADGSLSAE